jgi:cobalt-zinc-cadmium efflux system protein
LTDEQATHDHAALLAPHADVRFVLGALSLIAAFFVAELTAAVIGNSLVLLADAGHMLTDIAALALSAWAMRMAQKPAHGRWTYGYKRVEILAAATNGVALVVIALLIAAESIRRLVAPEHVTGSLILAVACAGAVVNVVTVVVLSRANRSNLNLRAAYAHIVTDLYAFVGTAVAGLVIVLAKWARADSVAALLVVVLMLWTAWGLLRDAGRILLQAAPEDLDLADVRTRLIEVDHVVDVHDLHAWTLTSGSITLSAHVVVEDDCFETGHAPRILDQLQACLRDDFGIDHATFQLEPAGHGRHEDAVHP